MSVHQLATYKDVKKFHILSAIVLALSLITSLVVTQKASAVFSDVLVRFDRMQTSTASTGTVCANPSTVATEASVRVTFPTGYTVSGTAGNHTVSTATTTGWPAGAVAWPTIATATAVSSQTVTYPGGDLTVGTLYCFNWTGASAVTTQGSASNTNTGTVETFTSAPASIESSTYTVSTIADDTIDVTATVPQAFSFAINNTTDALGTLSSGSVTTSPSPRTITVNTNAQGGWMVWAREDATNAGLYSTFATKSIDTASPGTAATLAAGTEGYITGISDSQGGGSGTITVAGGYDYDLATDGASLDSTLRTLATSNGTASNAVLTIRNQVAIAGLTPAATDYSDQITFVGAGMF